MRFLHSVLGWMRSKIKKFTRIGLIGAATVIFFGFSLILAMRFLQPELVNDPAPVDFPSIYRMAILAKDVYDLSEQEFHSKYAGTGQRLGVQELPGSQVRYLVLIDDERKTQTVAVRGSSNLQNWLMNADYLKRVHPKLNVYLHEGFSTAADELWRELRPVLKKGHRTTITGHSLGGAIAAILMMRLMSEGYEIDNVVTFGQPKVTNEAGAVAFAHSKLLRVVNGDDIGDFSKVSALNRAWSEHYAAPSWSAGVWGRAVRGAYPAPGAAPDAPWS
jgi:hypothetical protein